MTPHQQLIASLSAEIDRLEAVTLKTYNGLDAQDLETELHQQRAWAAELLTYRVALVEASRYGDQENFLFVLSQELIDVATTFTDPHQNTGCRRAARNIYSLVRGRM